MQPARPSRRSSDAAGYRATGAGEPLRSVSVSNIRGATKRRSRKGPSRLSVVLLVVAILAGVLGIGAFALYHSNLFPVTKVTVSGVEHLTAEEMTELAAIPDTTTLIRLDTQGVTDRLKSNSWVRDAAVERVFPDTVNLNITERRITAVCDVTVDNDSQSTQTWALASDGMWLMQIPDRTSDEGRAIASRVYEDVDAALRISNVPYGSVPEAGTTCTNANILNALSIISGMTTDLADQVKSVSASSSESTTLTLTNGVEIAFGDSSNIRDKERVCLQLMEEHPNQIAYINVRVVNKPVWRSV